MFVKGLQKTLFAAKLHKTETNNETLECKYCLVWLISANILEEPVASIFNTEDWRDGGSKFLTHFSTSLPDYMTSCH